VTQRAPALPAEERRASIIDATVPLLIRDGLQVRTTDIAAAAGIAEGTIFRVFPDKRALLIATIRAVCDSTEMDRAIDAIDRGGSLTDQLTAAIAIMQRRFVEVWQVLTAVGPRVPTPRPRDQKALARLLKPFAAKLVCSPAEAARQIAAIVIATSLPTMYPDAPLSPDRISRLVLNGLAR